MGVLEAKTVIFRAILTIVDVDIEQKKKMAKWFAP